MKKLMFGLGLCALAVAAHAGALTDWFVDQAAKSGIAETIVITPGYKVLIDGNPTAVMGHAMCPRSDGVHVWFIGGDPQGSDGCAVIKKNTTSVLMLVLVKEKPIDELWTVERQTPSRMALRRPNGEYVIPAK